MSGSNVPVDVAHAGGLILHAERKSHKLTTSYASRTGQQQLYNPVLPYPHIGQQQFATQQLHAAHQLYATQQQPSSFQLAPEAVAAQPLKKKKPAGGQHFQPALHAVAEQPESVKAPPEPKGAPRGDVGTEGIGLPLPGRSHALPPLKRGERRLPGGFTLSPALAMRMEEAHKRWRLSLKPEAKSSDCVSRSCFFSFGRR